MIKAFHTDRTGSDALPCKKRRGCFFPSAICLICAAALLQSCVRADVPGVRQASIPTPTSAEERREAVNERPDPVLYLPLGRDVLLPEISQADPLPSEIVGPFELRSETVAGALQLVLADYKIPLAFQSDAGLDKRITVANLQGPLGKVVNRICGLADLYCAYEDGMLVVKEKETFTVKVPPISQDASFMSNVAKGLQAITGKAPITDDSTRTIIYEATQRTAEMAERYFQRMRASTALIVFETYIWEVNLNTGNSMGINWSMLKSFGKFSGSIGLTGSVGADFTNPISIGLPTTKGADGQISASDVVKFLSTFGAVKTISQPQITVLSGAEAKLRAADKENFVSRVSETIDNGQATTAVDTSSVDTGFTLTIGSAWDNASVYANIEILLTDVSEIQDFEFSSDASGSTKVQLPKTTERELNTQVRVRPGDSLLIAGLVRENDSFDKTGPGVLSPIIPTSRTTQSGNLELVFLLRPRVVVFTSPTENEQFRERHEKAHEKALEQEIKQQASTVAGSGENSADTPAGAVSRADEFEPAPEFNYTFDPLQEAEPVAENSGGKTVKVPENGAKPSVPESRPIDLLPPDALDPASQPETGD